MTEEQLIIKRELQEAQYIGEDGGMVVDGTFTKEEAYALMINKILVDCGEEESDQFRSDVSPEEIGIGYFFLVTEENRHKFDSDIEWYVSVRDTSPYLVWVYWG